MKNTLLPLALGLIAVFVAIKSVRDHNAAQRDLQAAREAARASSALAGNLDVENDRLRKQLASARSHAVDEIELARLRADATELKRLKLTPVMPRLAAVTPASAAAPAAPKPADVEAAYSLEGTVRLNFGAMVVGGGWKLQEGRRAFLFAAPTRDESGNIMLDARLVEMPEEAAARFGLQEVVAGARASDKFLVRDAASKAEFIRGLELTEGVEVLTGPRVLTRPGGDATIQVQGNPESGEPGVRIGFTPNVQADGVSLDLGIKLRFVPDDGKSGQ